MAGSLRTRLAKAELKLGPDDQTACGVLTYSQVEAWQVANPDAEGSFLCVPDPVTVDEWLSAAAEWSEVLPGLIAKAYESECEMVQPAETNTLPTESPDKQDPPITETKPKKKKPSLSPLAMQKRRAKNEAVWRETVRRW